MCSIKVWKFHKSYNIFNYENIIYMTDIIYRANISADTLVANAY